MHGKNIIVVYGQTGSGKSYSMVVMEKIKEFFQFLGMKFLVELKKI